MLATFAGCAKSPPVVAPPSIYASAEDVELNFRGRTFVLGDNNQIAEVRPLDWRKNKFLKLPFWFGVNILVPGVMAPKEGDFYVISEATLEKPLDAPGEWMTRDEAVRAYRRIFVKYRMAGEFSPLRLNRATKPLAQALSLLIGGRWYDTHARHSSVG